MSTLPQLTRGDVLAGRQVAELLHLPSSTVLEYARRGVIPAHKLGRRWVFIRDELATALRAAPSLEPRRPPSRAAQPRDAMHGAQLPLPFDSAA